MTAPEHHLDALPALLAEVAEQTTLGAALALARDFGGIRTYFPKRPKAESKLARSIGLVAAEALGEIFGGTYQDIPRFAAGRALAIARAEGSTAEVARRFHVTDRYVRIVRASYGRKDDRQADLFPED